MNIRALRLIGNLVVVAWLYLMLGTNWLAEPGVVSRLGPKVPFLENAHEAIWPLVYRPTVY